MFTKDEAYELARNHVAAQPSPAPGYSITLGKMAVVESGWYFDYGIKCELDIRENESEQFAGAVGFLVNRESGGISVVSHSEWVDLGLAYCDDPYSFPDDTG